MSIGYSLDSETGVVFLRAWGQLTDAELRALSEALATDPRFRPEFRVVADLRPITRDSVSPQFLRQGFRSAFHPTARRAVVVAAPEPYGMARLYARTANLQEEALALFPDLPPAFAWLGLPADTVWPEAFPEARWGPR